MLYVNFKKIKSIIILCVLLLTNVSCFQQVESQTDQDSDNSSKPDVKFSLPSFTLTEGSSVIAVLVLSKAANKSFTVNWEIPQSNANDHFSSTSGQISVPKGAITATIPFQASQNSIYHGALEFSLNIVDETGDSLVADSGIDFTLNDDESSPEVDFVLATSNFGEQTGEASIEIQISPASSQDILLNYSIAGTATSADHDLVPQQITISAGSTSANITFDVTNDALIEGDQNILFTINTVTTSLVADIGTNSTHDFIIVDDDNIPVEPTYATNGANWNDYIANSDTTKDKNHQTDTACSTSNIGIDACIHAGERRKMTLLGESSCTNLTASDELGVFDWACDSSAGYVVFYSYALKAGKGLRDLVSSTAWLNNKLNVYKSSVLYVSSASAQWWTNDIKALPANNGAGAINLPSGDDADNTIYVVPSSMTVSGYNLNADKLSLVTLSNNFLRYSGNSTFNCNTANGNTDASNNRFCVLSSGTQSYQWVEAKINCSVSAGDQAYYALFSVGLSRSVVINSEFNNCSRWPGSSFYMGGANANKVRNLKGQNGRILVRLINSGTTETKYNHFQDIVASNNTGNDAFGSILLSGTGQKYNVFHNVSISNHRQYSGLYFTGTTENNIFTKMLTASNKVNGINTLGGNLNTITHLTAINNEGVGQKIDNISIASQILTVNNGGTGLVIDTLNVPGSKVSTVASVNNQSYGISSSDTNTQGLLQFMLLGSNNSGGDQCSASTSNGGIENLTCTVSGTNESSNYSSGNSNSNAVLHLNKFASSTTFGGKLSSDTVNTTANVNTTGTQSYASITDWLNFEDSIFRAWGKDGSSFPNVDHTGACTTGLTCRVWDYRLKSSDANKFFMNKSGDGKNNNTSFLSGVTCPSAVHGNRSIAGFSTEINRDAIGNNDGVCSAGEACDTNIYLVNALEILNDDIGDDDGLCESSEACIYSPNIGAYQGHGDYLSNGKCLFENGNVSNVQMYAYPVNGI